MNPNDTKKGSFLDRFSGKNAASSTNTNDSMFLNTDLIHEGISDDDLDMLLSGDIKSTAHPPKNPMPAEFSEEELAMDSLEDMLELEEVSDALDLDTLDADETLDLDEDELLGLDALDAVLAADTSEPETAQSEASQIEAVPLELEQPDTAQLDENDAVPTLPVSDGSVLASFSTDSSENNSTNNPTNISVNSEALGSQLSNEATNSVASDNISSHTETGQQVEASLLEDMEVVDLITPLSEQNLQTQTTQTEDDAIALNQTVTDNSTTAEQTITVAENPTLSLADVDDSPTLTTETQNTANTALDVTVETAAISSEQLAAADNTTPAESMKAQLTSSLPNFSTSVLATGATTAVGGTLAATSSNTAPASEETPSQSVQQGADVQSQSNETQSTETLTAEEPVTEQPDTAQQQQPTTPVSENSSTATPAVQESKKDDTSELKTVLHPIPESVKSRLNSLDALNETEKQVSSAAVSITATHTPKPAAGSASKPTFNKPSGKNTMSNENQAALLEKVQVDIDELKRKLHSMNSDFYNAATDSAVLISQVRELETKSAGDFNGTYVQSRELRRLLVDARKIFNQLASGIDMLEESLETDLYTVEKKA